MPLTSPIIAYDEQWPAAFLDEAEGLRPIFGATLVEFHHVGSTAVPGLSAKAEIDMLAVVETSDPMERWIVGLAERGYRRGGDLSAGHHFFKRDVGQVRTHKLHVCVGGHAMGISMLRFRDRLRQCMTDRQAYEVLKRRLAAENRHGIKEYLRGKEPLILAILDRTD